MTPTKRCAVYTRKSSEEGLEQGFNSLHAQREACEAFIKSQAGEGWTLVPTHYDDGGISGGTMQRPALQKLLADITAGKVDVVVVYKVDRLTRSLADFAKMVELFDAKCVSFVAVTQQFNTTTSMGRLTLNVLLSFAQFEREVTGERIRDKIAASKRKGMWMGGVVPMGYKASGRELTIDPEGAKLVRRIHERYLALKSVRLVKEELDAAGIKSRPRERQGKVQGGKPIFPGVIYWILRNPLYVGDIAHKGVIHRGLHKPIIDRKTWDAVQKALMDAKARPRGEARATEPSPLLGKLIDESGKPLTPAHSAKGSTRRRYYISRSLRTRQGEPEKAWRLPAPVIEGSVTSLAIRALTNKAAVVAAAKAQPDVSPQEALASAASVVQRLRTASARADALRTVVDRVDLTRDTLSYNLSLEVGKQRLALSRREPMKLRRRGIELRMLLQTEQDNSGPDPTLLRAMARGHRWLQTLLSGRAVSIADIARKEKIADRYVSRLIRLAFLSPQITSLVVSGKQTPATLQQLLYGKLPLRWEQQWTAVAAQT